MSWLSLRRRRLAEDRHVERIDRRRLGAEERIDRRWRSVSSTRKRTTGGKRERRAHSQPRSVYGLPPLLPTRGAYPWMPKDDSSLWNDFMTALLDTSSDASAQDPPMTFLGLTLTPERKRSRAKPMRLLDFGDRLDRLKNFGLVEEKTARLRRKRERREEKRRRKKQRKRREARESKTANRRLARRAAAPSPHRRSPRVDPADYLPNTKRPRRPRAKSQPPSVRRSSFSRAPEQRSQIRAVRHLGQKKTPTHGRPCPPRPTTTGRRHDPDPESSASPIAPPTPPSPERSPSPPRAPQLPEPEPSPLPPVSDPGDMEASPPVARVVSRELSPPARDEHMHVVSLEPFSDLPQRNTAMEEDSPSPSRVYYAGPEPSPTPPPPNRDPPEPPSEHSPTPPPPKRFGQWVRGTRARSLSPSPPNPALPTGTTPPSPSLDPWDDTFHCKTPPGSPTPPTGRKWPSFGDGWEYLFSEDSEPDELVVKTPPRFPTPDLTFRSSLLLEEHPSPAASRSIRETPPPPMRPPAPPPLPNAYDEPGEQSTGAGKSMHGGVIVRGCLEGHPSPRKRADEDTSTGKSPESRSPESRSLPSGASSMSTSNKSGSPSSSIAEEWGITLGADEEGARAREDETQSGKNTRFYVTLDGSVLMFG